MFNLPKILLLYILIIVLGTVESKVMRCNLKNEFCSYLPVCIQTGELSSQTKHHSLFKMLCFLLFRLKI